jgi:hypothetical protein
MASVTRFVSLRFLDLQTVGRTPWAGDQPEIIAKEPVNDKGSRTMQLGGYDTKDLPPILISTRSSLIEKCVHFITNYNEDLFSPNYDLN